MRETPLTPVASLFGALRLSSDSSQFHLLETWVPRVGGLNEGGRLVSPEFTLSSPPLPPGLLATHPNHRLFLRPFPSSGP